MNIIDLIIILFIILGGLFGFKDGVFKKLVSTVGLLLVLVIAFMLKGKLSVYFYENLPFIDLWGVFKGIQVLNVIFYEALAFLIIASLLMVVYKVILGVTGIFDRVLKATVILNFPSRVLGFIVGLIEHYLWVYVILFIITLPVINLKEVYESKVANYILKNTPYISSYSEKTLNVYNDIYDLVERKKELTNSEINEESMDLMLKYDMITVESAEKLINSNKVDVDDAEFLDKYRGE